MIDAPRPRAVVRFYNKRGRAEQWIKEGKQARALDATLVSPVSGQRGALAAERLAYNLGNLRRRLVLPARIDSWSLTSLQ